MDTGGVPEQFGVVLGLDPDYVPDLPHVREVIAERVSAVPRLRQRLVRPPLGCGGPIWVDDGAFDIRNHVRAVPCRPPGDEQAVLDTAMEAVETPLPRDAPLWAAIFVTDPDQGGAALVVVLHHVLADGVGGLDVLANLVDEGATPSVAPFPRPGPTARLLARDALASRLAALRGAPRSWRLLRTAMTAGGGLRPPKAAPCSLVRRTGPTRRVSVVRADLETLRAAAHRHGATTNDAVLVAVAGALHRVLEARGEALDAFAVTVPVSGRSEDGQTLGNQVSPLLVSVPGVGYVGKRLALVAADMRAHKAAAKGPAPIALLGWLFRPMARIGLYRWYMNHQHRLHTLVSHVRGPSFPVTFDGARITTATPIATAEGGNITAYFEALSYAGVLTVAALVDADHFPDLDRLVAGLQAELDLVMQVEAAAR